MSAKRVNKFIIYGIFTCVGIRAFMMTMNKNISDQKKVARSQIYQKIIQREYQKLCENPKHVKITESLTNPLLSRDYREIKKKISQLLFTITLDFHHPHLNYDGISFYREN